MSDQWPLGSVVWYVWLSITFCKNFTVSKYLYWFKSISMQMLYDYNTRQHTPLHIPRVIGKYKWHRLSLVNFLQLVKYPIKKHRGNWRLPKPRVVGSNPTGHARNFHFVKLACCSKLLFMPRIDILFCLVCIYVCLPVCPSICLLSSLTFAITFEQ